ncbi:MAG: Coenzyme F420 hydrogenase/dehydrogenase, beta subunit C-terminal domain [Clostridia bacterium]
MNTGIVEKNHCYGCRACEAVCPTNSISMKEDPEGFLYPVLNKNTCINCRKCVKVCPAINGSIIEHSNLKKAYCGLHFDDTIWQQSSSGGAYSAVCKAAVGEKSRTIFMGATYDKNNNVVHSFVKDLTEIKIFRKSKYVQSDLLGMLKLAKGFISEGYYLIFSGTPCQVAALNNYLHMERIDCTNYLTIDFVCHGVGSPLVFKRYLEWLALKYKSTVRTYSFRNRIVRYNKLFYYISKITLENGKEAMIKDDTYVNLFLQKLICRPSCSNCRFSNMNRVSDITIGDFKKQNEIAPLAKGIKNRSLLIPNSYIGEDIVSKLSDYMELFEVDILKCIKANPPLEKCSVGSTYRSNFFNDLIDFNYNQLQKKYFQKRSLLLSFWLLIPNKLQTVIKKVLKK